MGLWDMIRGAEKAQGDHYNPGVGRKEGAGGPLSVKGLSAIFGIGVGKKGGRE